jgi:hypothetical protein
LWSGGLEGSEILFVFEGQFDSFDFLVGAGAEIGNGAVFDLAVLAIRLAEQDAVIGSTVDGGFGAVEIHSEHILWIFIPQCKQKV